MLETLYHELTAKRELDRTFADTVREIQSAIEQMTDAERRQYLSESLFLNFVSYENERLGAYLKKLAQAGVSPHKQAQPGASPRKPEKSGSGPRKPVKKGATSRTPVRKRAK